MFISNIFGNLSSKAKLVLIIGLALAFASAPICIAIILTNSGSISYKSGDKTIDFQGQIKKSANDSEYSNKLLLEKLQRLDKDFQDLKSGKKKLKEFDQTYGEFLPTATEAITKSEELTDFVDSAIKDGDK